MFMLLKIASSFRAAGFRASKCYKHMPVKYMSTNKITSHLSSTGVQCNILLEKQVTFPDAWASVVDNSDQWRLLARPGLWSDACVSGRPPQRPDGLGVSGSEPAVLCILENHLGGSGKSGWRLIWH